MVKKVEVEGKEFYGVILRSPKPCDQCSFKTWVWNHSECIGPQRLACSGWQSLLTPEKFIKLKLKGEVL